MGERRCSLSSDWVTLDQWVLRLHSWILSVWVRRACLLSHYHLRFVSFRSGVPTPLSTNLARSSAINSFIFLVRDSSYTQHDSFYHLEPFCRGLPFVPRSETVCVGGRIQGSFPRLPRRQNEVCLRASVYLSLIHI